MQWFAENPIGFQFMRWYRNLNFLYNMKKVTIVFDFESQSLDVSVNDARECVTPATTVEEMLANEVFVPADLQSLVVANPQETRLLPLCCKTAQMDFTWI